MDEFQNLLEKFYDFMLDLIFFVDSYNEQSDLHFLNRLKFNFLNFHYLDFFRVRHLLRILSQLSSI